MESLRRIRVRLVYSDGRLHRARRSLSTRVHGGNASGTAAAAMQLLVQRKIVRGRTHSFLFFAIPSRFEFLVHEPVPRNVLEHSSIPRLEPNRDLGRLEPRSRKNRTETSEEPSRSIHYERFELFTEDLPKSLEFSLFCIFCELYVKNILFPLYTFGSTRVLLSIGNILFSDLYVQNGTTFWY